MLEKIITSKTRIKILKLFLTNIDNRYYLRELERMLDESLSPLRRQLLKLTQMGILVTEEEGNLKFYKLNKEFKGIETLRKLVMGEDVGAGVIAEPGTAEPTRKLAFGQTRNLRGSGSETEVKARPPIRKEVLALSLVSVFVLLAAIFITYISSKSVRHVEELVKEGRPGVSAEGHAKATRPDEMISRKWKVIPGNVPVLSSGETGGGGTGEEL